MGFELNWRGGDETLEKFYFIGCEFCISGLDGLSRGPRNRSLDALVILGQLLLKSSASSLENGND